MALETFSVCMDATLKKQFDALCQEFGMNTSTAINDFAKTVVRQRKIAFEIFSTMDITKDGAMRAFKTLRMQAEENGVSDMSLEDINKEISLARNKKIAEGENRLSSLIQKLLSLNRYDDIEKATSSVIERERLYREFGIINEPVEMENGVKLTKRYESFFDAVGNIDIDSEAVNELRRASTK